MRITDKGLEYILSLGCKKETSTSGVYFLYEWENVSYLACPNEKVAPPSDYECPVMIVLSKEQYYLLEGEKEESSISTVNTFNQVSDYYEKFVIIKFDQEKQSYSFVKNLGNEDLLLKNFMSKVDAPSPLKIMHDTKKPFHGRYSPISHFDNSLNSCDISNKNLWITAYPILSEKREVTGAFLGFSNLETDIETEVLSDFEKFESTAKFYL